MKTMSDENMKRRVKVNTAELPIGAVFYLFEQSVYAYCIAAQGPQVYACKILGVVRGVCNNHEDVWIDDPRTKVGDFGLGERFRRCGFTYVVTATGETTSIVKRVIDDEAFAGEILINHFESADEVSDEGELGCL